jgi:peptidoglycan hydrolase CwlO-like protein
MMMLKPCFTAKNCTLLDKIDQQRSEINSLLVEVKQYQNRIHRLQKRQRLINISFAVLALF